MTEYTCLHSSNIINLSGTFFHYSFMQIVISNNKLLIYALQNYTAYD